jgi:hypothetical protein
LHRLCDLQQQRITHFEDGTDGHGRKRIGDSG